MVEMHSPFQHAYTWREGRQIGPNRIFPTFIHFVTHVMTVLMHNIRKDYLRTLSVEFILSLASSRFV